MSAISEIASIEVQHEIHALVVRFTALLSLTAPEHRSDLLNRMIGAGAALIAGAVANSQDPVAAREQVEANFKELLDLCLSIQAPQDAPKGSLQ